MTAHVYNVRPDLPDHRDRLFVPDFLREILSFLDPSKPVTPPVLNSMVDLRPEMPPIVDQGSLGSCTANAIAGDMEYLTHSYAPSRLFIYYNERAAQGTVNQDSGSTLRIGMQTTQKFGACPETEWPYDISKYQVDPTPACYQAAIPDRVHSYYRIPVGSGSIELIRHALSLKLPVVMGFVVYPSFESAYTAETGIVTMPTLSEAPIGGHAVLIVGYDDIKKCFIVRNSWGSDWGLSGYFLMPYAYVSNPHLTFDLWVIQTC